MLHEFLSENRSELIRRCRAKVSQRDAPPVTAEELEHGVPLFLEQLVAALRCEQESPASKPDGILDSSRKTATSVEASRTAAVHGKELLNKGYTVDQVVHGYGDICQSITELAAQTDVPISVEEFHTFNRLLDSAIADAVSSYGSHRDASLNAGKDRGEIEWRSTLGDEQRRLLETALRAFVALKTGNLGLRGATGTLLEMSLTRLRDLVDKSLPTGMSAPPKA